MSGTTTFGEYMTACAEVFWVDIDSFSGATVDQLDRTERDRMRTFTHDADMRRFALGAATVRVAVADRLGIAPADVPVNRTCPRCGRPHGRPRLPPGHAVSVTHSGALIGVALTCGLAVGLDVEHDLGRPQNASSMMQAVLHSSEQVPQTWSQFLRYWTRKESLVKATGDGLNVDLSTVVTSAPEAAPVLLDYPGRTLRAEMVDLMPRPGYPAALTILNILGLSSDPVFTELQS